MKLALIPPISLLEYTDETSCQLMLPHLVHNDVYNYVYRKHCEDPDQYVILDNGVAENETVEWSAINALAVDFDVDEIVIPDTLFGWKSTIDKARQWLDDGYVDPHYKYMFVAQGKSIQQFQICIDWALDQDWIDVIGLPRHALQTCGASSVRHYLANYIQGHYKGAKPVHLLGGSPGLPDELVLFEWPKCVRSTDTSSPFNFAYAGMSLAGSHVTINRPGSYFDQPAEKFPLDLTNENVRLLMEWTGNDLR